MENILTVKFKLLDGDILLGYGFTMPSKEHFINSYVPETFPDAIDLGDGKFQIDAHKYIVCE